MLNEKKIVFVGTPEFAVPALQALLDHGVSPTVVTAPERPTGRKKTMTQSPVHAIADAAHLTVITPEHVADMGPVLQQLQPDVCIIVAYGKIIPQKLLAIPTFGFLNIHPSLLPKYRGPSPIQTAILNGENETGVTIMKIDAQIDHGPIIAQESYGIPEGAYYEQVAQDLAQQGAELLLKSLPDYLDSTLPPKEQNHDLATSTKQFSLDDGRLDWHRPSEMIFNHIRALSHEPGTWTTWNGTTLKIHRAHPLFSKITNAVPGTVIKFDTAIAVRTASHYLALERVQLQGTRPMSIHAFVVGHPDFIGSTLAQ